MAKKSFDITGVSSVARGTKVSFHIQSAKNTPKFKEWKLTYLVPTGGSIDALVARVRNMAGMGTKRPVDRTALDGLKTGQGGLVHRYSYSTAAGARQG